MIYSTSTSEAHSGCFFLSIFSLLLRKTQNTSRMSIQRKPSIIEDTNPLFCSYDYHTIFFFWFQTSIQGWNAWPPDQKLNRSRHFGSRTESTESLQPCWQLYFHAVDVGATSILYTVKETTSWQTPSQSEKAKSLFCCLELHHFRNLRMVMTFLSFRFATSVWRLEKFVCEFVTEVSCSNSYEVY